LIGIAGGVFFFGYWTFAFGYSQVNGGNAGFVEIGWPGRYKGEQTDAAAATAAASPANATTGLKSPLTTKPATKGESFWQKLTTGQLPGQIGN
jgi:hypothetical protein